MLRLMGLEPFQSRLRLAHVEPQFEPFAVSRPFLERRVKIGERFGIPAFQIIRSPRERPPLRRVGGLGLERFDFFSRGREIPRPEAHPPPHDNHRAAPRPGESGTARLTVCAHAGRAKAAPKQAQTKPARNFLSIIWSTCRNNSRSRRASRSAGHLSSPP